MSREHLLPYQEGCGSMFKVYERASGRITGFDLLRDALSGVGVVFLGERHEVPSVLDVELRLLDALHSLSGDVSLALEHFNYRQQHLIDGYLSGRLEWDEVREGYERGFEGFNIDFYRPLIDYARENNIRVYGIMVPREKARLVSRRGLEALEELGEPVGPGDVWLGPPSYRERFFEAIQEALRSGPMGMLDPEKLFLAQAYKDEVAARRIVEVLGGRGSGRLSRGPPLMLVVMGAMHVAVEGGVPSRVARLLPGVSYRVVVAEPGLDEDSVEGFMAAPGFRVDYIVLA